MLSNIVNYNIKKDLKFIVNSWSFFFQDYSFSQSLFVTHYESEIMNKEQFITSIFIFKFHIKNNYYLIVIVLFKSTFTEMYKLSATGIFTVAFLKNTLPTANAGVTSAAVTVMSPAFPSNVPVV